MDEINRGIKITTVKLSGITKSRLDKLKVHRRETYDEILNKVLDILNVCKINPLRARAKLMVLDKAHRKTLRQYD